MRDWLIAHISSGVSDLTLDWPLDPLPLLVALAAAVAYFVAWRSVNARHPASPIPTWRLAAWLGGLLVILAALDSPIDTLAEDLLSAHMVQHLLLTMVAPPLLAFGAPVLLVLRVSRPSLRATVILPLLHSRPARVASSPITAWLLFTVVMWAAHFTPVFEAALEDDRIHVLEHVVFIVAGYLFWWPLVGADPMPGRLRFGPRLVYALAQMPVMAAVGLIIYFAPAVLYPHYLETAPARGLDPLVDQQIGGLLMWAVGDVVMIGAVTLLVAGWIRADARRTERRQWPPAGDPRAQGRGVD
ncbi:MAG TPA: cytochrome c oxidase assembly protein [Candidatus Limnocylindria bacterium]|jgi:putative copper resistance protein D